MFNVTTKTRRHFCVCGGKYLTSKVSSTQDYAAFTCSQKFDNSQCNPEVTSGFSKNKSF